MPPRTPDSKLAPFTARLGREPDHVIAKEAGVSRALIIQYRRRLGISAYEGYKFGSTGSPGSFKRPLQEPAAARPANKGGFRGRRSQLDPYAEMLGTVPDAEIAQLAGVTAENVRTYRGRRGIPAQWQERSEIPTPAPQAAAGPRTAYVVNVERAGSATGYAIIARDFGDAARVAVELVGRHQPGGAIKAIQRVGELLE